MSQHPAFQSPLHPWKRPTNLARSPLLVGPRRKKTNRGQRSAFPSDISRFAHLTFAHRVSALPWLVKDRAAFLARRIWCVLTQKPGLSATESLASRVPPPFRGHQIKGAVYTVCFLIKSWMFSELFLFAKKKIKFLTMVEIHCTSRSYLGTFILCAPNWS